MCGAPLWFLLHSGSKVLIFLKQPARQLPYFCTGTNYSTSMHFEGAGGVPPPDPQLKRKQSHATLYLGLRQSGGKHDNSKSTVPGIF